MSLNFVIPEFPNSRVPKPFDPPIPGSQIRSLWNSFDSLPPHSFDNIVLENWIPMGKFLGTPFLILSVRPHRVLFALFPLLLCFPFFAPNVFALFLSPFLYSLSLSLSLPHTLSRPMVRMTLFIQPPSHIRMVVGESLRLFSIPYPLGDEDGPRAFQAPLPWGPKV